MTIDTEAVQALEKDWSPKDTPSDIRRLPLRSVTVMPGLYQARPHGNETNGVIDKSHVANLASILKDSEAADLDPITVLRVGKKNILVDGHHRLAAYKARKRSDIPVRWFSKGPQDALLEAGRENAKQRLPMGAYDRGQRAWELVCSGLSYSVTKITLGSGVSRRTVNTMRSKLKECQSDGVEPPERWMDVLLRGKTWDADEAEGKFAEQIAKLTTAISKGLGPAKSFKSTSRIDALAAALIGWSARNAEELALSLVEALGLEERIMEAAGESELVEEWREAKRLQEQRTEF